LGSTNGVRVNGKDITGEHDLVPGDVVELSPGGPAFSIFVESEALCLEGPAQPATPPGPGADFPGSHGRTSPRPDAENKTLRHPGNRRGRFLYATALAAVGSVVGALYYDHDREATTPSPANAERPVAIGAPAPDSPPPVQIPQEDAAKIPQEDAAKRLARSTVYLGARWRLYDAFTGKPVFQKMVTRRGRRLPCFVELGDRRIVPWLTTADEEHTNIPIGGSSFGSGFIVSETGGVITSRHIAAAWTMAYQGGADWTRQGVVFRVQRDPARDASSAVIDLYGSDGDGARLASWVPGHGGLLFRARYPVPLGPAQSHLEGRNELLNVRFPLSRAGMPARLVRTSDEADIAEIKIDSDRPLPAVELAEEADVKVGERVTALGYPMPPDDTAASDMGEPDLRLTALPELTTADGTVTGLDPVTGTPEPRRPGDDSDIAISGQILELTPPADSSIEGGPVFAADGRVLAVVGPDSTGKSGAAYAYSVRFIRALLELQ
jgi:serine protease Do